MYKNFRLIGEKEKNKPKKFSILLKFNLIYIYTRRGKSSQHFYSVLFSF